jgi:hypothetical protein
VQIWTFRRNLTLGRELVGAVRQCSRVDRCGRLGQTYILRRDVLMTMNIKTTAFSDVTP